jgi:hypothetical protein
LVSGTPKRSASGAVALWRSNVFSDSATAAAFALSKGGALDNTRVTA